MFAIDLRGFESFESFAVLNGFMDYRRRRGEYRTVDKFIL